MVKERIVNGKIYQNSMCCHKYQHVVDRRRRRLFVTIHVWYVVPLASSFYTQIITPLFTAQMTKLWESWIPEWRYTYLTHCVSCIERIHQSIHTAPYLIHIKIQFQPTCSQASLDSGMYSQGVSIKRQVQKVFDEKKVCTTSLYIRRALQFNYTSTIGMNV